MTAIQMRIITAGIKIKLARGEVLETILTAYVNLTDDEKVKIRLALEV